MIDTPWKKIRFKTETGHEYDGYVYETVIATGGKWVYVSENNTPESAFKAQNWVIADHQIIKYYE